MIEEEYREKLDEELKKMQDRLPNPLTMMDVDKMAGCYVAWKYNTGMFGIVQIISANDAETAQVRDRNNEVKTAPICQLYDIEGFGL